MIKSKALPKNKGAGLVGDATEGKGDRQTPEARTSWSCAALLIEAKSNKYDSPFKMPKDERKPSTQPNPLPRPGASPPGDAVPSTPSTGNAVSSAPPFDPSILSNPPQPAPAGTPPHEPAQGPPTMEASDGAPPESLHLYTDGGAQTLGQMAEYVSKVLQHQFILFFFTIFVCREYAWLLRWDRAGLVVSERFNFIDHPHVLHRFLYRFARLDDLQRGRDMTVSPATAQDLQLIRSFDLNTLTDWQKDAFRVAFTSGHPIYSIEVPQGDTISPSDLKAGMKTPQSAWSVPSEEMRRFLVGKPRFTGSSVVGRGTRAHIAYDVSGNRLVFCKEYWRLDVPSHYPEGDILMRLHSMGVPYIATPIVAGDVCSGGRIHRTHSQAFRPRSRAQYIQCRVIVVEVAEPLENYKTSQQLVAVMCHALLGPLLLLKPSFVFISNFLTAHEGAWKHAQVLHRDISAHNILIYRYRDASGILRVAGMLIDWGLCKLMKDLVKPPSRLSRSVSEKPLRRATMTQFLAAGNLAVHICCFARLPRSISTRRLARSGVLHSCPALDVSPLPQSQRIG